MTRTKKVLIGLGGGILVLIIALVIAVSVLNWNALRPTINERVSDALGRPFAINGDLSVRWERPDDVPGWRGWVPWPHVTANDVMVGNPPWVERREMAVVKRASFTIAPLPLITKDVIIRKIQLTGVSAHLERLKDGRANWVLTPPESDGEPSTWVIDIDEIGFDQGIVGFRDEILSADVEVQVDPLGKPIPYAEIVGNRKESEKEDKAQEARAEQTEREHNGKSKAPVLADAAAKTSADQQNEGTAANNGAADGAIPDDYRFGWKVEGHYQGVPVKGEGKIGGMLALSDVNRPFPVQAEVAAGKTRISAVGTLVDPVNLGALDLRLALSGDTMAALFPLTGVTLPDTPPYATDGQLSVRLHEAGGPVYHYRNFNGKVGNSDLHGNLTFKDSEPRAKLTGEMSSRQLRMVDLGPLIGVKPETKKAQPKEGESKPARDKVLPTEAFRTDRWRDMDADVTLTGARIIYDEKLPITKVDAHFIMDDGVLSLKPLRFGFVGGTIDADIKLDGRKQEMTGDAKVSARGLKLKELFPDVKTMQKALGQLNGDIALTGVGNSVAALLGTGNGDLHLIVNDGVVSKELMEIAGLNVGNYLLTKLFGDEEVKINCGVADMQMKQGIMTPRVFVFDTEDSIVQIEGDVNFKNETLDLHISPESKGIRLFSLRSPLYVKGTFAHPDAGVEVAPLVARGVGAVALGVLLTPVASLLALVAPSSSEESEGSCGALIKQVEAQR